VENDQGRKEGDIFRRERMNKQELLKNIAREANITKIQAEKALDAYFRLLENELRKGDRVVVSGFGTFTARGKAKNSLKGRSKSTLASKKGTINFVASPKLRKSLGK
jgi:DNA-binding protein HU-beta